MSVAAFWFFHEQAEAVVSGSADPYDSLIMEAVHTIDNPTMTDVMQVVTQLGSHAVIGSTAGITAIAMFRRGRRGEALTVVMCTGGAMAINTLLKHLFQRKRPQELARRIKLPKSHSFPSGHSLLSAATYPIVTQYWVQDRSASTQVAAHALSGLAILGVGFSRVYFGVHFPSDVLGGFAAGFGWLGLTALSHTISERADRDE